MNQHAQGNDGLTSFRLATRRLLQVAAIAIAAAVGVLAGTVVVGALAGVSDRTQFASTDRAPEDPNVKSLPAELPVLNKAGEIVGFAKKSELFGPPPAQPPGAPLADPYNGKPGVDVHNRDGAHIGWFVPNHGFATDAELATLTPETSVEVTTTVDASGQEITSNGVSSSALLPPTPVSP